MEGGVAGGVAMLVKRISYFFFVCGFSRRAGKGCLLLWGSDGIADNGSRFAGQSNVQQKVIRP